MKRKKLSRKASFKSFKKGATVTDTKNIAKRPMRGGYRL